MSQRRPEPALQLSHSAWYALVAGAVVVLVLKYCDAEQLKDVVMFGGLAGVSALLYRRQLPPPP